jgi:ATP-dependent DNA helicase RecG
MMIEGGERFGLAQLHQFRGRVGRGTRQSYCFVFTTNQDHSGNRRMKALQDVKTGFELAEYDLQFRGPGELSGRKQWGISDVGMEALKNIKMVEAARLEAQAIIAKDFELASHPLLRERVNNLGSEGHFE